MAPTDTETPVVSESYDQVVFTDPTEAFMEQLQRVAALPTLMYSQHDAFKAITYADTAHAQALVEAQKFVQGELAAVQGRLESVEQDLAGTEDALRQALERQKANVARHKSASVASGKK